MVIFLILTIVFFVLWLKSNKARKNEHSMRVNLEEKLIEVCKRNDELQQQNRSLVDDNTAKDARISDLSKYQQVLDAEAEARTILSNATEEAHQVRTQAKDAAAKLTTRAQQELDAALQESARIRAVAEENAKEIAGEAYQIADKAKEYSETAAAMKNIIDGYGDQYLKPTYSLLDDLAEDFGYTEAGQMLKQARDTSAKIVKTGRAATCDYVETSRRTTAIAFVVDAFNGKVDSILSKTKKDNYGTLEQKIKDAFTLVNHNGIAFRNAVITPEYLSARLEELKWAVVVSELKAQAQEEQRRIREQMREEEKARREYEKAMKDAAKEEEMLRKAMEKAQKEIENANEANRAEYEAKLADLQKQLQEAEERGQRAMSMAQQTRHGNVYVISNIGSFGENVYKVGMTRRLDPLDRVKELGDASVPFPFDVHAIIESDDAPALETALHKALSIMQVNKVNTKKEFFRVPLSDIKALVEHHGLETNWTMAAAAAEYRETLAIEETLKSDPDALHRWEEYNSSVSKSALEVPV